MSYQTETIINAHLKPGSHLQDTVVTPSGCLRRLMYLTLWYWNNLEMVSDMYTTVNPRFKPRGLITFMIDNHLGSNQERERVEIVT